MSLVAKYKLKIKFQNDEKIAKNPPKSLENSKFLKFS